MKSKLKTGSALVTLGLSLPLLLATHATVAQQNRQIEEVIITATKREQSLQDVAVAVSVVDGDMVENAQMDNGTDIARLSPNVNVSYFGLPDQPKFSLRGAATTDFALNTSSATGIIVDEVNLAASYFGGPLLFDVERIEALRGPQGTLFGKNTTGGAIHFITRAPSFETGGYIDTSVGNFGYTHVDGAYETTLSENLAARIAFTYSNSDGFWENHFPGGNDLGDIDNRAARLSFAYQGNDWDGTLRLFTSRSNPNAAGIIHDPFTTTGLNAFGTNPREGHGPCPAGQSYDRWEGCWDRSGVIDVETDGMYLTLNKDLGNYTLTSVTSLVSGSFLNLVDADGTGEAGNQLHIDFYAESDEKQQDLRLTSNFDGDFNFIAGLYYFDEQSYVPTTTYILNLFSTTRIFDQQRESIAAYFNGSLDLSDALALNFGLRWTRDNGDFTNYSSINYDPAGNLLVVNIANDPANDMDYNDSAPTGEIGLNYTTADDALVYGKYSRGYRSSAFDGTADVPSNLTKADAEFIDSIEFGYKTQLADNTIRLNSAVFFSQYKDMQFLNSIAPGESQIINLDAQMHGVELEVMALLSDNLMLSAGLGYLQAEFTDGFASDPALPLQTNGEFGVVDVDGKELIEAPEINFSLALDYDLHLDNSLMQFHVDTNFVDDQFFDVFNNDYVGTDSYWSANGRIAWIPGDGNLEFALWGKNITENDEYVGRIRVFNWQSVFSVAPQPRRFGLEASYKF